MKYIVEVKYTNPSHEFVTLRRRVESITRIVEARNEQEALNRVSNQQRALGFMIKEAKIVSQPSPAQSPVVAEAKKEDSKDETEMMDDEDEVEEEDEDEEDDEEDDETEVEDVKEAKDVTKDLRVSLKAMDLRHGVDSDKRDAGYKMSPAVRAAQKKSDALSKVVKRPQAGTLAAVHNSMERTMERNMKKEAVDPGEMRRVNKEVKVVTKDEKKTSKKTKAVELALKNAKGKKNPVNVQPVLTDKKD